ASLPRNQPATQLVFEVLCVHLPRSPDQINAICNFGHERFSKAKAPVTVFVVGREADSIAPGIGCVVETAIVIDCPIRELEVSVRSYGIQIKEVWDAELTEANLQATPGKFIE